MIVHATPEPADLNKIVVSQYALIGDATPTLDALIAELAVQGQSLSIFRRLKGPGSPIGYQSRPTPKHLLVHTEYCRVSQIPVDRANTIFSNDAGNSRDQVFASWESKVLSTHIGWDKTAQLGHGLGLEMGAEVVF